MVSSCALLVLCTFFLRVCSQVIYTDTTDDCTTEGPMLGNSVYCCSGACLDGTEIGNPGQCENWLNLCGDVDSPPSCTYNQVLSYDDPPTVDSGDGCCGACCCECQYQRNNWSWSCCDCPAGFIAVDVGTCGGTASPSCVGCQEPDQTLTGDPSTGFQCVASSSSSTSSSSSMTTTSDTSTNSATTSPSPTPTTSQPTASDTNSPSNTGSQSITPSPSTPSQSMTPSDTTTVSQSSLTSESNTNSRTNSPSQTSSLPSPSTSANSCQKAQALDDLLTKFGAWSTWAGAVCPTSDLPSAAVVLWQDVYGIVQAVKAPAQGVYKPSFIAASTVLSSISTFALGAAALAGAGALAETIPFIAALGATYEAACTANTVLGAAIAAVGASLDTTIPIYCGPAISRRSIFLAVRPNIQRDAFNPCAEYLSYFPTDYTVPSALDAGCDQLEADTAFPNITSPLQQACSNYQTSGNSTLLIEFTAVLQAIQAFVPYCSVDGGSSSRSFSANQSAPITTPLSFPGSDSTSLFGGSGITEGASRSTQTTYICDEGASSSNASPTANTAVSSTKAISSQLSPVPASPAGSGTYNAPIVVPETLSGESGTGGTKTGTVSSPSGSSTSTVGFLTASAAVSLRSATAFNIIAKVAMAGLLVGALWL